MSIDPAIFSVIHQHSKSFSLAQKLLPKNARLPSAVVYAWCRRADDAVDEACASEAGQALTRLEHELDAIYAGELLDDPVLHAFQQVVSEYGIPEEYPRELLQGMRMDLSHTSYRTLCDLHLYCYRVAGTVGLMMCHVLGVRHPRALKHAAHLGMAMQITNICRDVTEDWQRQRLYIPSVLLPAGIAAPLRPRAFPSEHRNSFASAVEQLLREADRLYSSGDRGLSYLTARSAWAIDVARLVYASIGGVLRVRNYDVTRGRAYVSTPQKLWLVARALGRSIVALPRRLLSPEPEESVSLAVRYPGDVFPI